MPDDVVVATTPVPAAVGPAPTGPAPVGPDGPASRLGFWALVRTRGYRRLLGTRFAAQWSDGMFQAALGGAVLFNPERQADPLAVAAGLAVLLLPYSLIGPFAGALLDRWDRRQVLVIANMVRAVLVALVSVVVLVGIDGPPLYLAALAVAGVSRFVLAGLSTALPHVVERRYIVESNTFAVTVGAALAAIGGASAIGLRELLGSGDAGSAATTAVGIVGSVVAAVVAAGFRRGRLGPDRSDGRTAVRAVLRGFADGARATAATPSVAASFLALASHRLAFGITTLVTLLLFRYAFTDVGPLLSGFAGVGVSVMLAAAGLATAALATPWLVHRWGRRRTVRVALSAAAVTQLGLAVFLSLPAILVAAFLIGLAGQIVKLCTDAAVQGEADDGVLGRVFALYDVVFNVGYVAAVAATALLSPPDGRAPWLLAAAAGVYVVGLLAHDVQLRRRG